MHTPAHFAIDLVGSTLSDPYLSYSAALFALAGPLHGCVHHLAIVSGSGVNAKQPRQPGSFEVATRNAGGDRRQHLSRQHQRLPLENLEERSGCPRVIMSNRSKWTTTDKYIALVMAMVF